MDQIEDVNVTMDGDNWWLATKHVTGRRNPATLNIFGAWDYSSRLQNDNDYMETLNAFANFDGKQGWLGGVTYNVYPERSKQPRHWKCSFCSNQTTHLTTVSGRIRLVKHGRANFGHAKSSRVVRVPFRKGAGATSSKRDTSDLSLVFISYIIMIFPRVKLGARFMRRIFEFPNGDRTGVIAAVGLAIGSIGVSSALGPSTPDCTPHFRSYCSDSALTTVSSCTKHSVAHQCVMILSYARARAFATPACPF